MWKLNSRRKFNSRKEFIKVNSRKQFENGILEKNWKWFLENKFKIKF